ncbi:MAG: aminotransferase class V-fold PLP-dependent enzyme [Pirellulales bacterium]|nr:aminotransferase class V-fold PLP-dependent enzyme [Pirellulales bacterium]
MASLNPLMVAEEWQFPPGVTYLNHGSFGPPPRIVQASQAQWRARMNANPMEFFDRVLEPAWFAARDILAKLVGASPDNLVFQENCTAAMNAVARSVIMRTGDEVLLTDHEYGAVVRIWQRKCQESGAHEPIIARLTTPFTTAQQVVDDILAAITPRTTIVVLSHITSATAVTLPVAHITAAIRACHGERVIVVVDGPHAVAQLDLGLDALDCDFYVASCHKWLCAPLGSGFLYAHPRWQANLSAPILSWGRVPPAQPREPRDEFLWPGTRDHSPYLTIPAAIDFLGQTVGWSQFREYTFGLAAHAKERLTAIYGRPPLAPATMEWCGTMALVELPPGDAPPIKRALWEQYGIECPVLNWQNRRFVRVSAHLYNTVDQIERLCAALSNLC